jgi:hypothetical protein
VTLILFFSRHTIHAAIDQFRLIRRLPRSLWGHTCALRTVLAQACRASLLWLIRTIALVLAWGAEWGKGADDDGIGRGKVAEAAAPLALLLGNTDALVLWWCVVCVVCGARTAVVVQAGEAAARRAVAAAAVAGAWWRCGHVVVCLCVRPACTHTYICLGLARL